MLNLGPQILASHTHLIEQKHLEIILKGTVSIIFTDPPCKVSNAGFTTFWLKKKYASPVGREPTIENNSLL